MGSLRAWMMLYLCLSWGGWVPGQAEIPTQIRVHLFQAAGPISQVMVEGPFQVVQPSPLRVNQGTYTVQVSQGGLELRYGPVAGGRSSKPLQRAQRFVFSPLSHGMVVITPPGRNARQYPGRLELSVDKRRFLRVVNQLPAREYVALVVSSETPPGWPLEALKAQVVLTQNRLRRYQVGDDLDDTTQQEVYLGRSHWRPEVAQAVSAVWGQSLVVKGRPIVPLYHASCAGHTSDARVFGNNYQLPGIESVPCAFCRQSPFGQPTIRLIPAPVFQQAFPWGMPNVVRQDHAARPLVVRFKNGKTQSGYAFWLALGQKLGWDKAPGLRYSLSQSADGRIKITSAGAGHGVGLCQQGAAAMARQGKTYRLILSYYFPQAKLTLHEYDL